MEQENINGKWWGFIETLKEHHGREDEQRQLMCEDSKQFGIMACPVSEITGCIWNKRLSAGRHDD